MRLLPILVVVVLAGCGGSARAPGFLDADRLSEAITKQINEKLNDPSPSQLDDLTASGVEQGESVDQVVCIQSTRSKREFSCKMKLTGGYSENIDILVSKDGKSWISE